jgi:hypothetical protein
VKDATVRRLNALDAEYTATADDNGDEFIDQLLADYPVAAEQLMTGDAA